VRLHKYIYSAYFKEVNLAKLYEWQEYVGAPLVFGCSVRGGLSASAGVQLSLSTAAPAPRVVAVEREG